MAAHKSLLPRASMPLLLNEKSQEDAQQLLLFQEALEQQEAPLGPDVVLKKYYH